MEQSVPQPGHNHHNDHTHHDHSDLPRHGALRVIFFFLFLIVLNVMLAVYSIYMLGLALAFDWSSLASGSLNAILESALNLLLYFSPIILTLFLNRLLYRAFRGGDGFRAGLGSSRCWRLSLFRRQRLRLYSAMVMFRRQTGSISTRFRCLQSNKRKKSTNRIKSHVQGDSCPPAHFIFFCILQRSMLQCFYYYLTEFLHETAFKQ